MVLENLVPVRLAERNPINMLPLAFLYSTIAIFLALWIFPSHAALVAVFLSTIACLPLMLNVIGFEKEKEERTRDYIKQLLFSFFRASRFRASRDELQPEENLLNFFIFLFLGLALSFSFWFIVLPQDFVSNLFYVQINTIKEINIGLGSALAGKYFGKILINNIKVLAFCVLFSFIYGAGAIFILVWNASVIGVAIGHSIRSGISSSANLAGAAGVVGYSSAISIGLLRYLIHGIPEILAYFIGGLAGGLISIAVIKHDWGSEKFTNTMRDAMLLVLLAAVVLAIAATLEVSISPMITR